MTLTMLRVLGAMWLLATPSVLRAEAVVLLPPRGDDQLVEAQAQAHQVLANTLSAQGLRVVSHAEAQAGMPEGPACATSDCAPALIASAHADLAAVLAVWAGSDGAPGVVFVTLVDRDGARFPGQSKVRRQDLQAAALAALLDARGLQLLGPGPWLRVAGEPDGARVFLDDQYVGAIPYRATIEPGEHRVKVAAEGYVPLERDVDVPAHRSRQVEMEIALDVLGNGPAGPADTTDTAGAQAYEYDAGSAGQGRAVLGPAVLGTAGLALSLYATVDMSRAGSCVDRDASDVCLRERRSQGAGGVYLGVGIGAMAGAMLWFLLSDDDTEEASTSLHIDVGPRGVAASGSF